VLVVDSDYHHLRAFDADDYRQPAGHHLSLDAVFHFLFSVAEV
jgi:hypothetical protein